MPADAAVRGLITAVGDMHLERFGSTDEIVQAKGELARGPAGRRAAGRQRRQRRARCGLRKAPQHCRVSAVRRNVRPRASTTRLEQVEFSKQGHVVRAADAASGTTRASTPLLGRPIILNLAGAFTLATALGVDPDVTVAAIRTLKPVSNRLEVVEERGITWIRDAYNSNQFGFRAALEVAAALPAARRFPRHAGRHRARGRAVRGQPALSREAAAVCDHTLVVSQTNRDGVSRRAPGRRPPDAQLVSVAGRAEAFSWLRETVKAGDPVILENDLPDLYERSTGVFWEPERSLATRLPPETWAEACNG